MKPESFLKDEHFAAFRERTKRGIYGYPADIALDEAIRVFNEEEKCVPFRGTLPPLTVDEVIAAIVAAPVYGNERTWFKQKPTLWEIARKKKMPKGALLVAESGACHWDSPLGKGQTCVKGQRIYLFLGLDKRPRMSRPLAPAQIFLIRELYSRAELTETTR
jgi:hypothetical protein